MALLTRTLLARTAVLEMFSPGRILLYRNPNPLYPETDWYLAIGEVEENRVIADASRPERSWTVPFVHVERPAGMINSQAMMTWQQVKDSGVTWESLRKSSWIDVLSGDLSASGITPTPEGTSVFTPPAPVNGSWT
jgi:hypothetical protein